MSKKELKNLTFEEKIKLIEEKDKIYLEGYIDRALKDFQPKKTA